MIQQNISQFIPIYINLLIVFMSFSVPIVGVLLSFFSDGIKKLELKYQKELEQYKENIKKQNKELEKKDIEIKDVERNIKELKSLESKTKRKSSNINPKKFILKLFIFLLLSIFIAQGSFLSQGFIFYLLAVISLIIFIYVIYILWGLLGILMELFRLTNEEKRNDYESITDLLSVLIKSVEKTAEYFLKKVFIYIDSKKIDKENFPIEFKSGQKQELEISFLNSETRMAKNVEVGFRIPISDFIVEKSDSYTIYNDGKINLIRFRVDSVQVNNNFYFEKPIIITSLKKGEYQIKTFIKGENIETIYRNLNFIVK